MSYHARNRLFTLCIGVVLATVGTAAADSELTVLGPVGERTADVAAVKGALRKSPIGTVSSTEIDVACATDPGCLVDAGTKVGAVRVVAITISPGGKITVMLVDVISHTLVGTRDVVIAPKKLAKDLGPTLIKTIDELTLDKAKGLFAEGNEHYNIGEFKQALDLYKLAYRVKPMPAFQFNIAQCHRKLGQHQDAIAMYQAYLVGVPDAANKGLVDSLIEESKKALADAQTLERERLSTEQKKAEAARKGKEATEAEATAAAEKSKAEQARIAADREREKTYNRHPARKWMLITGTLGLAAAGVGGYYGLQARDAEKKFDNGCQRGMLLLPDEIATCKGYLDRGNRDAKRANLLVGSGAAVALVSTIIFILDPGNVERPNRMVAVTPTSVNLVVRW